MELDAVDTIGNLRHALGFSPDAVDQPVFEIGADGDEVADQWPQQAPQQLVLEALAIQVEHVASVLAMHAQLDAGQHCDQLSLEAAQVAGVDQIWLQRAQRLEHAQVVAEVLALALVQADDFDAARLQLRFEVRIVLQADDRVPVAVGRHVLDQVDKAIFKAACIQLVDQVHYQPWLFKRHCHDRLRTGWTAAALLEKPCQRGRSWLRNTGTGRWRAPGAGTRRRVARQGRGHRHENSPRRRSSSHCGRFQS